MASPKKTRGLPFAFPVCPGGRSRIAGSGIAHLVTPDYTPAKRSSRVAKSVCPASTSILKRLPSAFRAAVARQPIRRLDRSVMSATLVISSLNLGTPLATHAQQDGRWSIMGRRNATHVPRGHLPQRLRPSRVCPALWVDSKMARRTARACGALQGTITPIRVPRAASASHQVLT